jgi:hypothetical protein
VIQSLTYLPKQGTVQCPGSQILEGEEGGGRGPSQLFKMIMTILTRPGNREKEKKRIKKKRVPNMTGSLELSHSVNPFIFH